VKLIAAIVTSAIGGYRPATARRGTTGRAIAGCGDVPKLHDTIRTVESGDYTIKSCCGATGIPDHRLYMGGLERAAGVGTVPARLATRQPCRMPSQPPRQ
jgi:hypothetical protein